MMTITASMTSRCEYRRGPRAGAAGRKDRFLRGRRDRVQGAPKFGSKDDVINYPKAQALVEIMLDEPSLHGLFDVLHANMFKPRGAWARRARRPAVRIVGGRTRSASLRWDADVVGAAHAARTEPNLQTRAGKMSFSGFHAYCFENRAGPRVHVKLRQAERATRRCRR